MERKSTEETVLNEIAYRRFKTDFKYLSEYAEAKVLTEAFNTASLQCEELKRENEELKVSAVEAMSFIDALLRYAPDATWETMNRDRAIENYETLNEALNKALRKDNN